MAVEERFGTESHGPAGPVKRKGPWSGRYPGCHLGENGRWATSWKGTLGCYPGVRPHSL